MALSRVESWLYLSGENFWPHRPSNTRAEMKRLGKAVGKDGIECGAIVTGRAGSNVDVHGFILRICRLSYVDIESYTSLFVVSQLKADATSLRVRAYRA